MGLYTLYKAVVSKLDRSPHSQESSALSCAYSLCSEEFFLTSQYVSDHKRRNIIPLSVNYSSGYIANTGPRKVHGGANYVRLSEM